MSTTKGVVVIFWLIFVLLWAQNIFALWHLDVFRTVLYSGEGWGLSDYAIASGKDGIIHIIYGDASNCLYHSYKDKMSWHTEIVVERIDYKWYPGIGAHIALDSNNSVHMIYNASIYKDPGFENKEVGLYYATNSSGDWVTEMVVSAAGENRSLGVYALVLDSHDNPHLCFVDSYETGEYPFKEYHADVYYATKDESGWHTEILDRKVGINYPVSTGVPPIDIDSNDNPHIILYKDGNWQYAYKSSMGWQSEIIEGFDDIYFWGASMVLDANDEPHIIPYFYFSYTYKDNTGWHTEELDEHGNCSWGSIALDANGNPNASYFCLDRWSYFDSQYIVKYAKRVEGKWHIEVVDRAQTVAIHLLGPFWVKFIGNAIREPVPIAVDVNGDPHIVYRKNIINSFAVFDYGSFPVTGLINHLVLATRCGSLD